ncbi:MAG: hypothetical protein HN904_07270 [Victivallales bacterium]|nr:hypothetical protein [Victivallales bacterium]MBT7162563.1 hypothetical protein [Victivallales bacterium]
MFRSAVYTAVALCLIGLALPAEPITVVSGVFTVDRTPPTTPEAVKPADGALLISPFLRLEATAQDALSGVAGYQFEMAGLPSQDLDTPYAVYRGLADGDYTWSVRARDAAGNLSEWASFDCQFALGGDTDEDGLPDAWELACFGRLDFTDGTVDSDQDGVSDLLEAEAESHGFEFYLTLAAGWNMVALPCDTTVDSAASLVAASDSPVWSWNAGTLRYEMNTAPPARAGLWVFVSEFTEAIPISGTPPDDDLLRLERGWNLVGSGLPAALDSTDGIEDIITWVDDGYELRDIADFNSELLQGYWMYVSLAGDRTLLQPE